jgi:general secretion pathway protein A
LSYGIHTGKGILLLTGDIGCGKTLLSRRLIVGMMPTRYDVALVANPALSPSELLDEVLSQFGLEPVRSKAGRLQILNERLELNAQRGIHSVLIVDEAQSIESNSAVESADRGSCASESVHGRGDEAVYRLSHEGGDRSDRRVYERGDCSHI